MQTSLDSVHAPEFRELSVAEIDEVAGGRDYWGGAVQGGIWGGASAAQAAATGASHTGIALSGAIGFAAGAGSHAASRS